ncbi:MAG: hypothetical protein M1825_001640 [Sarcosagium campestre]|nr:MAG: hypothetical protein M1825_001640 [Sarcosagium campestre]
MEDQSEYPPSPKRRRTTSPSGHSRSSGSPDELSGLTPSSFSPVRRKESNAYTHRDDRAPTSVSPSPSAILSASRPASLLSGSENESPDELDHTFYRSSLRQPHTLHSPSSRSPSIHESGDGDDESFQRHAADNNVRPALPPVNYRQKLILRGHKRGVAQVKFSPDGRWIASCSADATLKLWDAETGAPANTLVGHLAGISTLAWSPDSQIIASGSDDKSIRLWHVSTGKPSTSPLLGHSNYIYSIAFSPKGNMLVSGSYDEAVFLWDVRSGRLMRSLPAHSDPVGGVDFTRDGTLVVSCAGDGLIRIWDTATGQCLRTIVHEDNPPVTSVCFSPNGCYVLAWTLDSCLRLWDYVEGRCVKTYQGHLNGRFSVGGCFATVPSDFSSLASTSADADAAASTNSARVGTITGFSKDTKQRALIVSGSEDGEIVAWDVVSKEVVWRGGGGGGGGDNNKAAHQGVVLGVHVRGDRMVSCGIDGTVRVWQLDHGDNVVAAAGAAAAGDDDDDDDHDDDHDDHDHLDASLERRRRRRDDAEPLLSSITVDTPE